MKNVVKIMDFFFLLNEKGSPDGFINPTSLDNKGNTTCTTRSWYDYNCEYNTYIFVKVPLLELLISYQTLLCNNKFQLHS